MKLRKRLDNLIVASEGVGGYPNYYPHVPRTVAGAVRLRLEMKVENTVGREDISQVRNVSAFELLRIIGFSADEEGKARFIWREQNWVALICSNLGVKANGGEYGGPSADQPFVEGAPIYFPRYVMYYDGLFRSDLKRAAVCKYDTSKSADTLIRDWWDSKQAAQFFCLKETWLRLNADWLKVHTDDYDPKQELATLLGIEVNELPETLDSAELEMILTGKLIQQVEKESSGAAVPEDVMKHQAAPTEDEADEKPDTKTYYPPFNPHWNY